MRVVGRKLLARSGAARQHLMPRSRFLAVSTGRGKLYVLRRPSIHVEDYYRYCQAGLLEALRVANSAAHVWLTFPDETHIPPDTDPVVCMQIEHTLVAPGGRDTADAVVGSIPLPGDGQYLVRLEHAPMAYRRAAGIIEYSAPNVANVEDSSLAPLYASKAYYVAPLLTSPSLIAPRERVSVITMHGGPEDGRRGALLRSMEDLGLAPRNISGVWHDYADAFAHAAILVNVHQTDHHHTLEELRVLPALLHGLIVVTEEVPLLDRVPYGDLLIATPYDDLAVRVRDVVDHYQDHWQAIFGSDRLDRVVTALDRHNTQSFHAIATGVDSVAPPE